MAEVVKLGDTVQLRSGGPPMTVNGHLHAGMFSCSWFDAHGGLCTGSFSPAALKVIEASSRQPE